MTHKQKCKKPEFSRKEVTKIIMDWFNGLLNLPIELNPFTVAPNNKCLLITINDINKLTLDHDKLFDLLKEISSCIEINELYELISHEGLIKDTKKCMKIYESNRNRHIPIIITSENYNFTLLCNKYRY